MASSCTRRAAKCRWAPKHPVAGTDKNVRVIDYDGLGDVVVVAHSPFYRPQNFAVLQRESLNRATSAEQDLFATSERGGEGRHDSATKFALRALIESWRNEIQEFGVKTTILQPGVVDTPFWEVFSDGGEPVRFGEDLMLSSEEIGVLTYQIVDTPPHLAVNEITVRPSKQLR